MRVLTGVAELAALAPEWAQLAGAQREPMQSHAWQMAAVRCLHAGARLRVIVVYEGVRLVAAAPLVEVRRRGITWLEFPGAATLHEPASLLADAPEALAALCQAISAQRVPVALQRLDANGPAHAALAALAGHKRGGFALASSGGGSCLRVQTPGTWQDFLRHMPASRRHTIQRKRRLLEQHGAVSFERLVPGPDAVAQCLRAAFEVEARSWKGVAGSAVLQRPHSLEFFIDLGHRFAADRRLEIRLLRVGDSIAASQVGILHGERWWELKIGYDPRFAKCSPGMLLGIEGLREAHERQLQAHEFLGASAPWQRPFATGERALVTLVLYPFNAVGLSAFAMDGAAFVLRRLRARVGGAVAAVSGAGRAFAKALRDRVARARDALFDFRHGVETAGQVAVADFTGVDPSIAAHAVHYEATSVAKFATAMGILAPRFEGRCFVDLGSGKGRVLLLAAMHPFRRVIGVEISPALHARAQANAAAFARRNPRARAVECVCADASEYELPEDDLVVFLYNPFDAALLGKACARMLASVARAPRELDLVYVNPVHFEVIESNGRFERVCRDAALAVYRLHPAGLKPA